MSDKKGSELEHPKKMKGKDTSYGSISSQSGVLETRVATGLISAGHKPYLAYHVAGMGLKTKWVIFT